MAGMLFFAIIEVQPAINRNNSLGIFHPALLSSTNNPQLMKGVKGWVILSFLLCHR